MRLDPHLRNDGVIHLVQATTAPPASPIWVVILLASITAIVTITVAMVPVVTKRLELRHQKPAADEPSTAVDGSVDLVAELIRDAHRERDEAQDRAEVLEKRLADVRVELARVQARLEHLDPHRKE